MSGGDLRSMASGKMVRGTHPPRLKGSVYLHVLASSMLVTIIGLGSLMAMRVQSRSCRMTRDYAEARTCAVSAVELGLMHIKQNPAWRTAWPNGTWMQDRPLGGGTFTLHGIDPQDGDLADSPFDAVVLTGIGGKGAARHKTQVVLAPVIQPYEALNTCLHSSGRIHVKSGKVITAVGAPVSTNGELNNDGAIDGSAQAQSIAHTGTITGDLLVPAPVKPMPGADVISWYASKATALSAVSTIENNVLAPGYNPWGGTDPNGLYYLNTNGGNLLIRNCRIHGTLVVRLGSGTLTIDSAVLMHNYRPDFPALLVEGNVVMKCTSAGTPLSEATCAANFNPADAPYNGAYNSEQTDTYPNEIQGLVHVIGSLTFQQTARVVGAVLCDGPVYVDGANTIVHTPGLYTAPPHRYTRVERMAILPDSWQQVVD